jgi:hypothetical protein
MLQQETQDVSNIDSENFSVMDIGDSVHWHIKLK